jgi:hypothetical protein
MYVVAVLYTKRALIESLRQTGKSKSSLKSHSIVLLM